MPNTVRIWPVWARTVGAMIRAGTVVRFGCVKCRNIFDVDLVAIAAKSGDGASLINASTICRLTSCRGRGYFVAAKSLEAPLLTLVTVSMLDPLGVDGRPAIELEPPNPPAPPPPIDRDEKAAAAASDRISDQGA